MFNVSKEKLIKYLSDNKNNFLVINCNKNKKIDYIDKINFLSTGNIVYRFRNIFIISRFFKKDILLIDYHSLNEKELLNYLDKFDFINCKEYTHKELTILNKNNLLANNDYELKELNKYLLWLILENNEYYKDFNINDFNINLWNFRNYEINKYFIKKYYEEHIKVNNNYVSVFVILFK